METPNQITSQAEVARTFETDAGPNEVTSRHARTARPKLAVDTVLFAADNGALKCYLVQLKTGALKGKWAFPGGLVRVGEMLDRAAYQQLEAATGLRDVYIEQLFTFGDPSRDPRAHVVSVAYMALTSDPSRVILPSLKYVTGGWFEISELPPLAYDHALMAAYALKRLKAKLEYSNIAYSLLPESFTFKQLEQLYGIILERKLDRRNFRRRIMSMGLLRRLPRQQRGPHRPAALYTFSRRSLQMVEML